MWDLIAFYLRVYRVRHGQSGEELGRVLGESKATVSRLENGRMPLDGKRARTLDKAWKTNGLFELLVWYASIGHDPQWLSQYLDKEQDARIIKTYQGSVIPGLFQTEAYARELLVYGLEPDPEAALTQRLSRKGILDRERPPFVAALLSQNALEWPIGNPGIMRDQLAHLMELATQRNIVVRVVPRTWDVGAFPGLDGSFVLMTGDDFGEVAYSESPGRGRLISSPADVEEYVIRYDRISAVALPEVPSRELIREIMEKYDAAAHLA